MITLYLARHGQTEENMARIFQGHMPGTLTVEGIAQAEALRDTLRDISLDAVVSSDLKRCVDTVSYTHLDVYKRQVFGVSRQGGTEGFVQSLGGDFIQFFQTLSDGLSIC